MDFLDLYLAKCKYKDNRIATGMAKHRRIKDCWVGTFLWEEKRISRTMEVVLLLSPDGIHVDK